MDFKKTVFLYTHSWTQYLYFSWISQDLSSRHHPRRILSLNLLHFFKFLSPLCFALPQLQSSQHYPPDSLSGSLWRQCVFHARQGVPLCFTSAIYPFQSVLSDAFSQRDPPHIIKRKGKENFHALLLGPLQPYHLTKQYLHSK